MLSHKRASVLVLVTKTLRKLSLALNVRIHRLICSLDCWIYCQPCSLHRFCSAAEKTVRSVGRIKEAASRPPSVYSILLVVVHGRT